MSDCGHSCKMVGTLSRLPPTRCKRWGGGGGGDKQVAAAQASSCLQIQADLHSSLHSYESNGILADMDANQTVF